MPSPVQFNVSAGTLPPNFTGTPQQFLDAIAGLLLVAPVEDWNSFVVGSAAPTSDVGPWLKDGTEWWVWSAGAGAYVPVVANALTLRRFIGSTTPSNVDYDVWIQTDGGGVPQAIKIYSGGSWVDVYAATLSGYVAKATADVQYPKWNVGIGTNQFFVAGAAAAKVVFDDVGFDTGSGFNTGSNRFVAPVAGYYRVNASLRLDATATSHPTGMSHNLEIRVNGVQARLAEFNVGNVADGTTLPVDGTFLLAPNDYVEIWYSVGIASGSATWQVTSDSRKTIFEGFKLL